MDITWFALVNTINKTYLLHVCTFHALKGKIKQFYQLMWALLNFVYQLKVLYALMDSIIHDAL